MTDEQIIIDILRREGVYDNHPSDPGGETSYGISRVYHPEAWKDGPPSRQTAMAIYAHDYLKPFAFVEPIELRAQVVDIAVNCGVTAARGMLAMAQQQNVRPVHVALVIERLKYYARKVKDSPRKSVFLLGWTNRACEFL